jgi:hypothetical protein
MSWSLYQKENDTVVSNKISMRRERSIDQGIDFWLCNTVKFVGRMDTKVVNCYMRYHSKMCFPTTGGSTTESIAAASDLTEE